MQYRAYKVHNIRYNIQIPAIKHDKIEYMLMMQKRGNGGEKVIKNLEDSISTGQKM